MAIRETKDADVAAAMNSEEVALCLKSFVAFVAALETTGADMSRPVICGRLALNHSYEQYFHSYVIVGEFLFCLHDCLLQ